MCNLRSRALGVVQQRLRELQARVSAIETPGQADGRLGEVEQRLRDLQARVQEETSAEVPPRRLLDRTDSPFRSSKTVRYRSPPHLRSEHPMHAGGAIPDRQQALSGPCCHNEQAV